MKKILITGANGLLGQKLMALLSAQENCKLLATSKGDARFTIPSNVSYVNLDITNSVDCSSVVNDFLPDAIIHAAAMTQVDACEDKRELCDSINIEGTRNLILAIGNRKTHFVHISTDFIYEGDEEEYFEDSPMELSGFFLSSPFIP